MAIALQSMPWRMWQDVIYGISCKFWQTEERKERTKQSQQAQGETEPDAL